MTARTGAATRSARCRAATARTPFCAGIDAGAAGVDLQRVAEHDQNHDGEAANGRCGGGGVHGHDVALDVVAVAQVPRDTCQDVQSAGATDRREDDCRGAEVAVVCDFVEDAEHVLVACVREDDDGEGGECADWAGPFEDPDGAARGECVAFDVVGYDEDDEVGDGEEGDYGGVFERVESAEEGERDDDEPGSVSTQQGNRKGKTYMNAVIQNCLSAKKVMSPALGTKPTTTPGIKSPMMIK